jgi:hypothetical protein
VLFCAAAEACLVKLFKKQVTTAVQKKRTTQQACMQFGWGIVCFVLLLSFHWKDHRNSKQNKRGCFNLRQQACCAFMTAPTQQLSRRLWSRMTPAHFYCCTPQWQACSCSCCYCFWNWWPCSHCRCYRRQRLCSVVAFVASSVLLLLLLVGAAAEDTLLRLVADADNSLMMLSSLLLLLFVLVTDGLMMLSLFLAAPA